MSHRMIGLTVPDSHIISIRAARAEHKLLTEAARFRGMKLSTFIREAALEAAKQTQPVLTMSGGEERTTE